MNGRPNSRITQINHDGQWSDSDHAESSSSTLQADTWESGAFDAKV